MKRRRERRLAACFWLSLLLGVSQAFFVLPGVSTTSRRPASATARSTSPSNAPRQVELLKRDAANNDANEGCSEDEEDASAPSAPRNTTETLVTREMFQRALLADPPVVKRKANGKQKREYKVLDNRDSLPFRVENQVPDPYTKKEVKRKQANRVRKRPSSVEEGLKSSLYINGDDSDKKDDRTMIGEYFLDKHTTTGDVLEIGDTQYKVIRHKCQYKYAGGKRFVMVRKILQVKEIGRLQTEEYLHRQFRNSQEGGGGRV